MIQALISYSVPTIVFLLMIVAGTEVVISDFGSLKERLYLVLAGATAQLILIPMLAILIFKYLPPTGTIAAGAMLLAVSPGGGISNYYCYLGRCNVALSSAITATGTLLSLLTIPTWLYVVPTLPGISLELPEALIITILGQLFLLVVLPLGVGIHFRRACPGWVLRYGRALKYLSIALVLMVVVLVVWRDRATLGNVAVHVIFGATSFILITLLLGWLLGVGLNDRDRPVLAIECGVRNVGVALLLGRATLSDDRFGLFVMFLTVYFIIEIAILLTYAHYLSARLASSR